MNNKIIRDVLLAQEIKNSRKETLSLARILSIVNQRYQDRNVTLFVEALWDSNMEGLQPSKWVVIRSILQKHSPEWVHVFDNWGQHREVAISNYNELRDRLNGMSSLEKIHLNVVDIRKMIHIIALYELDFIILLSLKILDYKEIDSLPDEDHRFRGYYSTVIKNVRKLFGIERNHSLRMSRLGQDIADALRKQYNFRP